MHVLMAKVIASNHLPCKICSSPIVTAHMSHLIVLNYQSIYILDLGLYACVSICLTLKSWHIFLTAWLTNSLSETRNTGVQILWSQWSVKASMTTSCFLLLIVTSFTNVVSNAQNVFIANLSGPHWSQYVHMDNLWHSSLLPWVETIFDLHVFLDLVFL